MQIRRLRVPLVALVAVVLTLGPAGAPASARVEARPLSGAALLAIDRKAGFRNYLPTRMLPGFKVTTWTYQNGVLRVNFRNKAGWVVQWRVGPMLARSCATGKQGSFQLDGNKVWWAQNAKGQFAWRCEFGLDGEPLRLEAASSIPATKLGSTGLGTVAASAKRY